MFKELSEIEFQYILDTIKNIEEAIISHSEPENISCPNDTYVRLISLYAGEYDNDKPFCIKQVLQAFDFRSKR